jgi:hypothetical protein
MLGQAGFAAAVYYDDVLVSDTGVQGHKWLLTYKRPSDSGWWSDPNYKIDLSWKTGVAENCVAKSNWGDLFDRFKRQAPGSQGKTIWWPSCSNGVRYLPQVMSLLFPIQFRDHSEIL